MLPSVISAHLRPNRLQALRAAVVAGRVDQQVLPWAAGSVVRRVVVKAARVAHESDSTKGGAA